MSISVIVPVYNTKPYLRKCIDSILAQTYKDIEIILVDDGSCDGSETVCDEYAEKYPTRVKAVHQQNGGSSRARNTGIESATGDYLAFVDSDDYIDSNMYAELVRLSERYNSDYSAIEMQMEYEDGSSFCRNSDENEFCWKTEDALKQLNCYRYLHKSFCTGLFRKEILGGMRFPEGRKCEDYCLLYKVIARCNRVAYSSLPYYHYLQRPCSNSRTRDISLEPIKIAEEQLEFFRNRFPGLLYVAQSDLAFENMGIYTAYMRNDMECPKSLLKQIKTNCRRNIPAVFRYREVPLIKKVQVIVFCYCTQLYNVVISRTSHR